MPTRLIREGILTSDRINRLSDAAEVFYRRLLSRVDDHGLFDARPAVLIAGLYPLRLKTTENKCLQLLAETVAANLVKVYEIDGKRFLKCMDTKWKIRSEPRFPVPTNGTKYLSCEQLFTTVNLDVVRCTLSETLDSTKNTKSKTRAQVKDEPSPELPDWLPIPQWEAWIHARIKARHPPTNFALRLALIKLDGFRDAGHSVAAILAKSAMNNWSDVFEPKD